MFRGPARRAGRRTARRTMRRHMMLLPAGRIYRRRRLIVGGATLLLVGGAAYKIGQSQAQQIQQHTGKPPEDLTQPELEKAMDDLGIEDQPLTAEDKAAIEAEATDAKPAAATPSQPAPPAAKSSEAPPAATSAPQPAPSAAEPDYIGELKKLASLKDAGIITQEDFDAKKKQLLGL